MKLNVSTLGTRSLTYEILFITAARLRYIRELAMTDFCPRFYISDRGTVPLGTQYPREIPLDFIRRPPDTARSIV